MPLYVRVKKLVCSNFSRKHPKSSRTIGLECWGMCQGTTNYVLGSYCIFLKDVDKISNLPLTLFGVPLFLTRQDFSRFWYPPITSISSTVGYFFFAGSAAVGVAWVGCNGVFPGVDPAAVDLAEDPVAAAPPSPPAGFLGVIVMVAPLFTLPPEALLMEKSGGDGDGDGEMLGDWAGDGELGEGAGVGVQSEGFRVLSGD